jgi:hypothetical protein
LTDQITSLADIVRFFEAQLLVSLCLSPHEGR